MFPTFISILDIQSWWEVPSIAHFCSLFRSAFNLLDFDIEDLEEALLADGTEDNSWLQVLIVRLLSGCLPNNEISTFNYQMFLRRLFRQKCQEYELLHNPFNTDIDFQLLPLRTKVDILQALCDFRLDSEDVIDLLKHLEADSLRVEPLGYDSNNSAYWYFYGTRLYREDFPKGTSAKYLGASNNLSKKPAKPSVWQVICFTEEDWFQLAKKLSKSKTRLDRQLHSTISENFLPELARLFKEKERLKRNRLFDNFPRRSSRIKEQEDNDIIVTSPPTTQSLIFDPTHSIPPKPATPKSSTSVISSDNDSQHLAQITRREESYSRRRKLGAEAQYDDNESDSVQEIRQETDSISNDSSVRCEADQQELIDLVDSNSDEEAEAKSDGNNRSDSERSKGFRVGKRYAEDSMTKARDKQQQKREKEKSKGGKESGKVVRSSRRGKRPQKRGGRTGSDGESDDGRESRTTKNTDATTKSSRSSRSNKARGDKSREKPDKSSRDKPDKSSRGDKSEKDRTRSHKDKSGRDNNKRHKSKDKSEDRNSKSEDRSGKNGKKHKSSKSAGADALTTPSVGRQTNNSLASATGQIVIQSVSNPLRKKMKTSQVFSQTEEDLQVGMHKILDLVKDHEDAWPFVDPVEEEYAPNYYSIIRRPMDLQRMEERLDNGSYTTFSKFKGDFQLIVNNCRLYNGVDNEYTEMVDNLLNAFERATERYLDQITSSDDEIAVEYRDDRKKSKGHKRKYRDRSPSPIPAKRKPTLAAQTDEKKDSFSDSDDFFDEEKAKKIVSEIREKKHKKRSKIDQEDDVVIKKNKKNDENKKSKRGEEDVDVKKNKKNTGDAEVSPKKSKSKDGQQQEEESVINKKRSKVVEETTKLSKKHSKTSSKSDKFDKKNSSTENLTKDNKKHHKKAKESPTENGKRKKQLSDVTLKEENVIPENEATEKKKPGRKPKNKPSPDIVPAKVSKTKDRWNNTPPGRTPDSYKHLFSTPKRDKSDKVDAFAFSSDDDSPRIKKNAKTDVNSKKENKKKDVFLIDSKIDKKFATSTMFSDKNKSTLKDSPVKHKDKHNKLRETIEMLKAKNDIKTPYDFENDKTKENVVENIKKGTDKKAKTKQQLSSNNIVKDNKEFNFDEDHTTDSFDSKNNRSNKKATTFHTKSNDTIDALALATEQTLKDINKWLDDTPKFPDFSSNSNSPSHFSHLDEFVDSGKFMEEGKKKEEKKEKQAAPLLAPPPKPEPVPTKKELALAAKLEMQKKKAAAAKEKIPKKREVQRTIDRLQPGKSKGNLITNVPTANKPADELFHNFIKKDAKNSLIVKTDDSAPKLSLGSVLDSFGKHRFIDDPKKEGEEEELEKKTDVVKNIVSMKDIGVKIIDGKEELTKKEDVVKEEAKKVEDKVDVEKPIIGHSPGKATPNLSAWFKAFGAPKVPTPQQPISTEPTPTSVISTTTLPVVIKANATTAARPSNNQPPTQQQQQQQQQPPPPDTPITPFNPQQQQQQQQQHMPQQQLGGAIIGPRTRKISTGSSMSERSSFSQDMDSPRVGLDERGGGGYPAPYPSPLHQSPSGASPSIQSPRPDVSPRAAAYPASFNGQIRVGFYQDTVVSAKSSPDKSCSPRDPHTPYPQFGAEHVYTPPQANGATNVAAHGGPNCGMINAAGYSYNPYSYNHPSNTTPSSQPSQSPTTTPAQYSTALTPTPPYNNPSSPIIQQESPNNNYYPNPGSAGSNQGGKATPTGSNSSTGGTPQHYSGENSNSPATPQELVIGSAPGTPQSGISAGGHQGPQSLVGSEGYGLGSVQGSSAGMQQGDISPYGGRDTNSSSGGSQRIVDEFSQEPTDMVLEQTSKPDGSDGSSNRSSHGIIGGSTDMEIETYQNQSLPQGQHSPTIKRLSKQTTSSLPNDQYQLDSHKPPNVNPFRQQQHDIASQYRQQQQVSEQSPADKQQQQQSAAMFPVKKRAYNEQSHDDQPPSLPNQQQQPNYMDIMLRQQQQLEQPAMQVSPTATSSSRPDATPPGNKYVTQNIPDPRNTAQPAPPIKDQPTAHPSPLDLQQTAALRNPYNYYSTTSPANSYPLNIPTGARPSFNDGNKQLDMSKYTNMGYTGGDVTAGNTSAGNFARSAPYGYSNQAAAVGYKSLAADSRVGVQQQQQQQQSAIVTSQYGVRSDNGGDMSIPRSMYGGVDVGLGRNLATLSQIVDRYPGDLSTAPPSTNPTSTPVPAHGAGVPPPSYYSHSHNDLKQQQQQQQQQQQSTTSALFNKAVAATVAGSLAPAFMANSMVYSRNIAAAAAAAAAAASAAGAMYGGRVPQQSVVEGQVQVGEDKGSVDGTVAVVKRGRKKKVKNATTPTTSTSNNPSSATNVSNPTNLPAAPNLSSTTQQPQGFQSYAGLKSSAQAAVAAAAAAAAASAGIEPTAISLKTASVPGSAFNFGPTPTGLGGLGDGGGYGSLFVDEFSRAAAGGWYGGAGMAGMAAAAHHSRTASSISSQQRSTPDPIQTTQSTTNHHRTTPHHHPTAGNNQQQAHQQQQSSLSSLPSAASSSQQQPATITSTSPASSLTSLSSAAAAYSNFLSGRGAHAQGQSATHGYGAALSAAAFMAAGSTHQGVVGGTDGAGSPLYHQYLQQAQGMLHHHHHQGLLGQSAGYGVGPTGVGHGGAPPGYHAALGMRQGPYDTPMTRPPWL